MKFFFLICSKSFAKLQQWIVVLSTEKNISFRLLAMNV